MVRAMEMGLQPIPVGLSKKVPCVDWKEFQTVRVTEDDIEAWFRDFSNFNVGIVTGAISGVVVVDADTPEAVEFCRKNGLDSPVQVRTRKGRHYYWRHPGNGMRFSSRVHNAQTGKGFMDFPHLDFKGDGGYVVIPPSINRKEDADYPYVWEMACDWDDMPVWRGTPSFADVTNADPENFDFGALNLTDVKVKGPGMSVRERMERRVEELGRKLADGDGRNQLMIQFAGEQVRHGIVGDALEGEARRFMADFFLDPLEERELVTTLRSAEQMDRRNHPADYDASGQRIQTKAPEVPATIEKPATSLALITTKDIAELAAASAKNPFLADPWLRHSTISQVYAYSGHGKSLFTLGACWHMALARTDKTFGFIDIPEPVRVLYFDWENATETLAERMDLFRRSYGDPGDNLQIWSQSALAKQTGPINLLTKEGIELFLEYLKLVRPQVTVIDTVRSAFEGMKENDAHEWARFNRIVSNMRAMGMAVVVLHHANKPGEDGLGREAGSSNQLTQLDIQAKLVPLYRDPETAKERAGLAKPNIIEDLEKQLEPDSRLVSTIQVSWQKTRSPTENNITRAMGFAERDDGTQYLVWQRSPRQAARAMAARGATLSEIQTKLAVSGVVVSRRAVRGWTGL